MSILYFPCLYFSELAENYSDSIWSLNLKNVSRPVPKPWFFLFFLLFQVDYFSLLAHNLSVFFFPALILACAATGTAETGTGTLSFCYLLFIWKCLLLSVSVDWLAIAVCSSVPIYTNGSLCWYFLFKKRGGESHALTKLIHCFCF